MTQRGNEGKNAVTVYADPKTHREFKSTCALADLSMTEVLEAFMENKKAHTQFIYEYKREAERAGS